MNFKSEVEKELIELEKAEERRKMLLAQQMNTKGPATSFGIDSSFNKKKKVKDSKDIVINVYDEIIDKHLPPSQFSIFDHSTPQSIEKNRTWVRNEQTNQAPIPITKMKEFKEGVDAMLRETAPPKEGSIRNRMEIKRTFILKTGQVPPYSSCVVAHQAMNMA